MEKVWIVYGVDSYGDETLIDICSSKELADKVVNIFNDHDERGGEYFEVTIKEFCTDSVIKTYKSRLEDEIQILHKKRNSVGRSREIAALIGGFLFFVFSFVSLNDLTSKLAI